MVDREAEPTPFGAAQRNAQDRWKGFHVFLNDLEFIPGSAGSALGAGSEPFATVRDLLNTRRGSG